MRDTNKKIMLILWAVVAVFLVVILATREVKYTWESGDSFLNINQSDDYSASIEYFQKTYTFSETDFTKLRISLVSADAVLGPADGNEVVVDVSGYGWNWNNEPEVTIENHALIVKTPKNVDKNKVSSGNRKVVIQLPAAALATYFDADVATVSGNILTEDIKYDSLDAESVSGDIDVNGVVRVAQCESVSGNIEFETEAPLTGKSYFTSVSGDVTLKLPEDSSFYMEWQTLSGSVHNEFVNGKCAKNGSLDMLDGKPEIAIETVSGDLEVIKN